MTQRICVNCGHSIDDEIEAVYEKDINHPEDGYLCENCEEEQIRWYTQESPYI